MLIGYFDLILKLKIICPVSFSQDTMSKTPEEVSSFQVKESITPQEDLPPIKAQVIRLKRPMEKVQESTKRWIPDPEDNLLSQIKDKNSERNDCLAPDAAKLFDANLTDLEGYV